MNTKQYQNVSKVEIPSKTLDILTGHLLVLETDIVDERQVPCAKTDKTERKLESSNNKKTYPKYFASSL